ncbi:MAG TPA: hypothetical protein D7H86_02530 [Candidatus Poseidoniales archaeon]|nr:MAG TPA: hypothetical protein D7H86_02530 [Candidatus Poseidoniales archaeon]
MPEACVSIGGHVTLLFSIRDQSLLPRRQGSTGAGICLEEGVKVTVKTSDSSDEKPQFHIHLISSEGGVIDGNKPMYASLIEAFLSAHRIKKTKDHEVTVECSLPLSQGFGMSAAGLLACSIALGECYDCGEIGVLARLAHRIERQHSAGLGDVLGIWAGGVEIRTVPGAPPYPGKAKGFSIQKKGLLIWQNQEEKHTSTYIDHKGWKAKISTAGDTSMQRLTQHKWDKSIWPILLEEADNFSRNSGMLEDAGRNDLLSQINLQLEKENLHEYYSPHLCMIGTSAIILPKRLGHQEQNLEQLSQCLQKVGLGTLSVLMQ